MYELEECVKKLDSYLEEILPLVDGEIDIDMSEEKNHYYWNFDYKDRSYILTISKETGEIKGESWRKGTKAQYKKH